MNVKLIKTGEIIMAEKLYYIVNSGCDAITRGLARISDEDFPKFKTFIKNLNKFLLLFLPT